jgi:NO-binding membrane sensor protein with MHYT domain
MADGEPERNPATGVALGTISAMRNKKLMTIVGGMLIAIGIVGMIAIGSSAANVMQNQGFSFPDMGKSFQIGEYVFMFVLIGGLFLVIYSQVSLQRIRAKERDAQRRNTTDTGANTA